ncbi:MAG: Sporulation protein YabP [Thermoanaerobacterales bacterium 50_218]|nr:MAG: Sporulation protein YabP [Thermoanaerobacterales bacterium 50_218]HAA89084.1 sporulation protein YabP [Peptococcaceae bacterium]
MVEGGDQKLVLTNRKKLEATGVLQILSYDAEEINLETGIGLLVLKGEGMVVTHLDLDQGEVVVQGLLNEIVYSEDRGKKIKAKGKNILERLLK